jgi:hypothetical protein
MRLKGTGEEKRRSRIRYETSWQAGACQISEPPEDGRNAVAINPTEGAEALLIFFLALFFHYIAFRFSCPRFCVTTVYPIERAQSRYPQRRLKLCESKGNQTAYRTVHWVMVLAPATGF